MPKAILVVDDSFSMRKMVAFTLQEQGYDVTESVNGRDALNRLNTNEFDAIVADVNMPVMDGITFVREDRAIQNHKLTPILMLTTESSTDKVQAGRTAGATGWLVKPFQPAKLHEAVQTVLD